MRIDTIIRLLKTVQIQLDKIIRTSTGKDNAEILIVRNQNGKPRFYARGKDRRERYLTEQQGEKIRLLAQQRYEKRLVNMARFERDHVRKCLKLLEPDVDIEKVYDSMPEDLKPFIVADGTTDKGFGRKWQEERVPSARPLVDGEGYRTMRGENVRSKSEVIIADRLFHAGIPYRYEVMIPLEFEDIIRVYPDFQILNVRTRKVFYWEHLGMLGDIDYFDNQLKKISGYARNGYVPGKNLLLTFESKNRPLDVFCVEALIKEFLI